MEFREGMLGVVIVALALTGAFFVSYLSGIETTEQEVTKYDYLADVSGLFDYDKSPQYIEFDPSTNYTGYYSTASNGYFPEDEVGYESLRSGNANNYRLNIEPTTLSSSTLDLSTATIGIEHPFDGLAQTIHFANRDSSYISNTEYQKNPDTITLKSYISTMELDENVTDIQFKSMGNYVETDEGSEYDTNWVEFSTKSMWSTSNTNAHLWLGTEGWFQENGRVAPYSWTVVQTENVTIKYTMYMPCLSCWVDLQTGLVSLYYDNDCKELFSTAFLDDVCITFGGTSSGIVAKVIVFDDSVEAIELNTVKEYLDPAYGVTMKDAEA